MSLKHFLLVNYLSLTQLMLNSLSYYLLVYSPTLVALSKTSRFFNFSSSYTNDNASFCSLVIIINLSFCTSIVNILHNYNF